MEGSVNIIELQQNEVLVVSGGSLGSFLGDLVVVSIPPLVLIGMTIWENTGGFTGGYAYDGLGYLSKVVATGKYMSQGRNAKMLAYGIIAYLVSVYGFQYVLGGTVEWLVS